MSNIRKLTWYFYKPLLFWNLAFSFVYLGLIVYYGTKIIGYGFYFKLLGYGSTVFLQNYTARNVYMYYRNAGYSIRRMYSYTFAIDFTIYLALLIIYLTVRHEFIKG
jgi:hypothetical protein